MEKEIIYYDYNLRSTFTGVYYHNTKEPILVGEKVEFEFNKYFGIEKGIICFKEGIFGVNIESPSQLKDVFREISCYMKKVNELNNETSN